MDRPGGGRLSTTLKSGIVWLGLWLAIDAATQCIGAWRHVFVCAPARGYSLPRSLGVPADVDLVLTFMCASGALLAAGLLWLSRTCCDVTITTELAGSKPAGGRAALGP